MTHEGRMARGKAYFDSNKNLDNADTLYYLANKVEEKPVKEVKKAKKEKKEDGE
jgi:hypothetical protein